MGAEISLVLKASGWDAALHFQLLGYKKKWEKPNCEGGENGLVH